MFKYIVIALLFLISPTYAAGPTLKMTMCSHPQIDALMAQPGQVPDLVLNSREKQVAFHKAINGKPPRGVYDEVRFYIDNKIVAAVMMKGGCTFQLGFLPLGQYLLFKARYKGQTT